MAQISDSQGDEESAISDYKEAINLGELDPGTISHTVALLYQRRRFTEADRLIRRLQEQQSPFSTDITRLAAEVSLQLNDTERALALVTKAALTSTDPNEHVWAGRILSALGRNDEAAANLLRVANRVGARYPISYYFLGRLYELKGNLKLAEEAFAKAATAYGPKSAQFLLDLSRVREGQGDFKGALAAMEEYVALMERQGRKPGWSDERLTALRQKIK